MAAINVFSCNVRGLGEQHKRRDVIHFLKNNKCDILMLQDTHLTQEKTSSFNSLWNGKAYHSCFKNNSRGTSILFNKNIQHEVINTFTDEKGNFIILECKISTDTYILGSVYGPNRDEPDFYERIGNILDSTDYDHVIIGGDFNFVVNPDVDCYGYLQEHNVRARKKFMSICNKYDLIDIWRKQNPAKQQYTWFTPSRQKGARLDMFFVSQHLSVLCNEMHISPGYRTDHSQISISLVASQSRGPGLWKLNESLLNDEDYTEIVNNCILNTVEEYALPIYTKDYISHVPNFKEIQFKINDDLFYETLLMLIRGETVQYSKRKAKQKREKEKDLMTEITRAEARADSAQSEENISHLNGLKEKLENLRKPFIDGLIVRTRAKWHEEGERPSKYFLSMEKRNAIRKIPTCLKIEGQIFSKTFSILNEFTKDLAKKYGKDQNPSPSMKNFITKNISNTLNMNERILLDQPITFEELTNAMRNMKKGKSPGSNGFTACFFRRFWDKLGPLLHRAFAYALENNKTLMMHQEGIVTMIPKAGKPPDSIKGWRPITLLNVDFKIISAAISARLQKVMGNLIDSCQTAYMKGRYIGENTRLIFDVINNLTKHNNSGLIMSVDFEAAFDSISWNFLSSVLEEYNFGPSFRKTIQLMYLNNDNFSRIMLNGFLGNKITLRCGIRQGDPTSGYLFNLAVNLLANQIKQSRLVRGIKLEDNIEIRIAQYADDTVLFLQDAQCLNGALRELEYFSEASMLKVNVDKTTCLPIGPPNQNNSGDQGGVKWVTKMKVLGIIFENNNTNITEVNLQPKLLQIQKEIAHWRRRNLTVLGRITVVKSLLISKLVHLFTALPNPPKKDLKNLNKLLYQFIWAGRRDPIKRAKLIQNYTNGGLSMIDIQAFVNSMKLTWLKRLMQSQAQWTKVSVLELPKPIQEIMSYGNKFIRKIKVKVTNQFWKDVLEAFELFTREHIPDTEEMLSESIWFSDYTKFTGSMIRSWHSRGIRFIYDLFDENTGRLHTKESLEKAYNIKMTFLCYTSLVRSLPDSIKKHLN